jgi:hypothetical protein
VSHLSALPARLSGKIDAMKPPSSKARRSYGYAGAIQRGGRGLKRALGAASDSAYRTKNRRLPKVLVYTDSRGKNLNGPFGKTNRGSYVLKLRAKYALTYRVCPETYTTIPDFIEFLSTLRPDAYDAIVLHCGIVDFSPRPLSSLERLKATKAASERFRDLFTRNEEYYATPFAEEYYGEPTITMYSPEFLVDVIVPSLARLPQLIWVSSGRFVSGWDGNYTKGRPENIDEVVSRFDTALSQHLPRVVNIRDWTPRQVQERTIDNVHFTPKGFARVFTMIDEEIQAIGIDPQQQRPDSLTVGK